MPQTIAAEKAIIITSGSYSRTLRGTLRPSGNKAVFSHSSYPNLFRLTRHGNARQIYPHSALKSPYTRNLPHDQSSPPDTSTSRDDSPTARGGASGKSGPFFQTSSAPFAATETLAGYDRPKQASVEVIDAALQLSESGRELAAQP